MLGMGLPICCVLGRKVGAADHQEVLSVILFRRPGEIERPRNDGLAVDHHDFVVGYGVLGVDLDRNARVLYEICRRVFLALLGFVQNDFDLDAPLSQRRILRPAEKRAYRSFESDQSWVSLCLRL